MGIIILQRLVTQFLLDLAKLTGELKHKPNDLDLYSNRHPKWDEPVWTRTPEVNPSIIRRNPNCSMN